MTEERFEKIEQENHDSETSDGSAKEEIEETTSKSDQVEEQSQSPNTGGSPGAHNPSNTNPPALPPPDALRSIRDRFPDIELFHTPNGFCYASFTINGHRETWRIDSKHFEMLIAEVLYRSRSRVPAAASIKDVINSLMGFARFDGPERQVYVRVAWHGGKIYHDLCNEDWEAVEITPGGWTIVSSPDVRFIRTDQMLSLPHPERGGSLDDLLQLINVPVPSGWILIRGWLVQAIYPVGPFVVLAVLGEQGSGKTILLEMCRCLIDPNQALLRSAPTSERDLVITASNSWTLGFDNLSGLSDSMSDALCRVASGGGFSTRRLYTDDEEVVIDVQRPIMINGIDQIPGRSDLMDRSMVINLPIISPSDRKAEKELWDEFSKIQPKLLGALHDAVSSSLRNLPTVQLASLPRMADAAKRVTAAEPALGLPPGTFINVYNDNQRDAHGMILEASLAAQAILALVAPGQTWNGTATELLEALEKIVITQQSTPNNLPRGATALSKELNRIAPNLRVVEVHVSRPPRRSKQRTIRIENRNTVSSTSPSSHSVSP